MTSAQLTDPYTERHALCRGVGVTVGEQPKDQQSDPNEWEWLAGWFGAATELLEEGADLWSHLQHDWEGLARSETPWTTDTIMNEVINSWEHVTPFWGEALQHTIDLGAWSLRSWWPTAAEDIATWRSTVDDSALGTEASKYMDLAQRATGRMGRAEYEAADAVDDGAALYGMMAKDAWRRVGESRAHDNGSGTRVGDEPEGRGDDAAPRDETKPNEPTG